MSLTPRLVSAAQPRAKIYALTDGHGLLLQVTPQGSKRWRFRYRFTGRENTISSGVYPKVGLAKARRLHADARGLLARGIDPSVERRRLRAAKAPTSVRHHRRLPRPPRAAPINIVPRSATPSDWGSYCVRWMSSKGDRSPVSP
jgi:hypothetical protein